MPLAAGRSLSHYEILAPLGAGGMGEVSSPATRPERGPLPVDEALDIS